MPETTPRIRVRERVRSSSPPGPVAQVPNDPSPVPRNAAFASKSAAAPQIEADQQKESALILASPPTSAMVSTSSLLSPATAARAAVYEVGYGRPPKASRFQPGRSGNPKGRPKHARNTRTIVTELLDRSINVTAQGRSKKISVREASLQQIGKRAVEKGDLKSFAFLLNVESGGLVTPSSARHAGSASNVDSDNLANEPSAQELEILAFAHRERLRDAGLGDGQIEAVLASLGLLPAMPAADGPTSHSAANDRDIVDQFEDA